MSAEWVTAIATAGTFVVIAASAIAALVQLRHMRGSNQIVALTECRETVESPDFREAQRFVSYELPKRLQDLEKHRGGSYPAGVPHLPGDRSFIDAVKGTSYVR